MIYLDNSATTRPCPEAVQAMTHMLTECWETRPLCTIWVWRQSAG